MSTRPPRAALSLGLAATVAAACSADAGTGVTLEIASDPQAPPATHLMLDWFDGQRALFRGRRVPPGAGPLPADDPITVRIETATAMRGAIRRALVRGMSAGGQVSEGAGTVVLGSGGWRTMTVKLVAGRLPDRDLDGVPDAIDGCPDDEARNAGCEDPPASPDAAVAADAGARADQTGDLSIATDDAGSTDAAGTAPADAGAPPSPDQRAADDSPAPAADARAPAAADLARDSQPPPPDVTPDVAPDGPRPVVCGAVMLVVGGAEERGDTLMAERLREMGCQATLRDDDDLATGDASGKALVIVSESTLASKIGGKLRGVPVPVITMEPTLLDEMALTGPVENTDWAKNLPQTQLTILDAGHPMAASLNGTVTLFAAPAALGWGKPEPAAIRIASIEGNIGQLVIFGYETGAPMVPATVTAPARRVALTLDHAALTALKPPGWALFDAAVRWAMRTQ